MTQLDPHNPLGAEFRKEIQMPISIFLAHQREQLGLISPEFQVLLDIAGQLTSNGKRLRPAFCTWGYLAFADVEYPPSWIFAISASLDLLHVSALIHDDVMDSSDTRRGEPSTHRRLEALHLGRGLSGDAEAFGRNGAILLGNLMWSWSAEMANWIRLPKDTFQGALLTLDRIRTEVNAGQYLDILLGAERNTLLSKPAELLKRVEQVVEYKTSRYTISTPLTLGAQFAKTPESAMEQLTHFAAALGKAFQYRDDVLGVFGDESITGKPSGDDLREGKLTALIAHTAELANQSDIAELAGLLGNPELSAASIEWLRALIIDSGALAATEAEIESSYAQAVEVLDSLEITDAAQTALRSLATSSVKRQA